MEHCIKPLNEAVTSEVNNWVMPKGLTKRASKLLYIMSGFPEISLIKNILLVNGRNIIKVKSFLKNVYSAKRPSGKTKIILEILKGVAMTQLGRSNMLVFKKINRVKKIIRTKKHK